MLDLITADGRRQIKTDDYSITEVSTGLDRLEFSVSINDPLYQYICEESQIYETTSRQTFLVKSIDGGQKRADIMAELDLDDWRQVIYPSYYNNTSSIGTTLSAVIPDGWTLVDETASTQRRGVTMDGPTPLGIALQCETTYGCAIRFDNNLKTATILYPSQNEDSGIRFTGAANMRGAPEFRGKSTAFVTRLYPIGKAGLTIAAVNNGVPYVENHNYSDKVICDVWVDERYEDAQSLMEDAQAMVDESANPRRTWIIDVADLYRIDPSMWPGMKLELFQVGTVVDDYRGMVFQTQIIERKSWPHYPEKNTITVSTSFRKVASSRDTLTGITDPNSPYNQQLSAKIGGVSGQWTPVVDGVSTYVSRSGRWIKQGNFVTLLFAIRISKSKSEAAAGTEISVSGFADQCGAIAEEAGGGGVFLAGGLDGQPFAGFFGAAGGTTFGPRMYNTDGDLAIVRMDGTEMTMLIGSLSYYAAS